MDVTGRRSIHDHSYISSETKRLHIQDQPLDKTNSTAKARKEKKISLNSSEENCSQNDSELQLSHLDAIPDSVLCHSSEEKERKTVGDTSNKMMHRKKNQGIVGSIELSPADKLLKSDQHQGKRYFNRKYFLVISIMSLSLIILFLSFSLTSSMCEDKNSQIIDIEPNFSKNFSKILVDFQTNLKKVKSKFSAQGRETWKTIYASVISIIKEEPVQPGVVLLLPEKEAENTTECLAQNLTQAVNKAFKVEEIQPIDGIAFAESSPENAKINIERELNERLKEAHAIHLKKINRLHGESAMILHAYCDNINAPYKMAAFFISLDSYLENGDQSNVDKIGEHVINSLWREHLDLDTLSSLISRLVVSAVLVKKEMTENIRDCL